jgi:hypothetical protein
MLTTLDILHAEDGPPIATRTSGLEGESERHRERVERAEQWLHKVYTEIEERFLGQVNSRARPMAP